MYICTHNAVRLYIHIHMCGVSVDMDMFIAVHINSFMFLERNTSPMILYICINYLSCLEQVRLIQEKLESFQAALKKDKNDF